MNLVYRRITYIIFILIFFIVAPAAILYTQGYRYNFKRQKLQKTGILIISSIPKKADIYLNGKLYEDDKTPVKIETLLSADYEIKLSKDGYHDWQKKLPIYESITTFAEDVILWKQSFPIILNDQDIKNWLISPDNKKIMAINNKNELLFFNLENDEIKIIEEISGYNSLNLLNWSNTSKKIIIKANNKLKSDYFILNIDQIKPTLIKLDKNYLPQETTIIKWDLQSDNTIHTLNNDGIWSTDLFAQNYSLISQNTTTQDFVISGNLLYTFENKIISEQNIKNSNETKKLTEIKCDDCKFVQKSSSKIILLDENQQKIFIIDPENTQSIIKNLAKKIKWLNDNSLLFYNDWEIWIYELNKKEPELITRFGQTIQKVVWHPEGKHLIFSSNNQIKIIELDNRELRNIVELAKVDLVDNMEINNSGDDLYFSGKLIGDQDFIFKLNIR